MDLFFKCCIQTTISLNTFDKANYEHICPPVGTSMPFLWLTKMRMLCSLHYSLFTPLGDTLQYRNNDSPMLQQFLGSYCVRKVQKSDPTKCIIVE